ncbi:MAG: hypothetical protein WA154_12850 [Moraxellaceae bacterium]
MKLRSTTKRVVLLGASLLFFVPMAAPAVAAVSGATLVGTTNGSSGTSSVMTTNAGVTVSPGQLLLLAGGCTNSRSITTPAPTNTGASAWTYLDGTGGGTAPVSYAYKIADATISPSTAITITYTGSCAKASQLWAFSGVDTTSPIAAVGTASTGMGAVPSASITATGGSGNLVFSATFSPGIVGSSNYTHSANYASNQTTTTISTNGFYTAQRGGVPAGVETKTDSISPVDKQWSMRLLEIAAAPVVITQGPSGNRLRFVTALPPGPPPPIGVLPGASPPGANFTSGFTTDQPADAGTPGDRGYTYEPFAAWVDPPGMTLREVTNVGIISEKASTDAERALGITSNVTAFGLRCDGGDTKWTYSRSTDPRTGVLGWFIQVDPLNYAPGRHECHGISLVSTGKAKVLQGTYAASQQSGSFYFTADYGNLLSSPLRYVKTAANGGSNTVNGGDCGRLTTTACATISFARRRIAIQNGGGATGGEVGGGRICLSGETHLVGDAAENYNWAATDRWLDVEGCPEIGGGRLTTVLKPATSAVATIRVQKVHWKNLKWDMSDYANGGGVKQGGAVSQQFMIWGEGTDWVGRGKHVQAQTPIASGFPAGRFMTESTWSNNLGRTALTLTRNMEINRTGGDVLVGTATAINTNTDANGPDFLDYANGPTSQAITLAGSNILTNVSSFYDVQVGSGLKVCGFGLDGIAQTFVTSIDTVARTLTIDQTCPVSGPTELDSGAHVDIGQYESGNHYGYIRYNVHVTQHAGQGEFAKARGDGTGVKHMMWFGSSYTTNYSGASPYVYKVFQMGVVASDLFSYNTTWDGSWNLDQGTTPTRWNGTDFIVEGSTCTNGKPTTPSLATGFVFRNSASCQ